MKADRTGGYRPGRTRLTRAAVCLVPLLIVAFASCRGPESPIQPTATVTGAGLTPTPTPGAGPAPTATRTAAAASPTAIARLPTPVPALPASRFQFGRNVSLADRAEIEAGVSLATRYLKALADLKPPAVTVYAYVDIADVSVPWEGIASASGNSPAEIQRELGIYVAQALPGTVLINVGAAQWKELTSVHQLRLAVHEYFHAVQMDLVGPKLAKLYYSSPTDQVTPVGPNWLLEGSAELIGWSALQSADLLSLDDHIAKLQPPDLSLAGLESFLGFFIHGQPSYDLSLDAVYRLVSVRGPASLVQYYGLIGAGQTWQSAFEQAFGQTPADFYEKYSAVSRSD
jgi:hypothetical protein